MIVACASPAFAQSEPIALDSAACTSVDTTELRRILALERSLEDGPDALQVQLRCDSDRAWVRAGSRERVLELASVPEGLRPRLLALAIAELRPAPKPKKVEPPPPVVEAPQRFRLALAAHGQRSSLFAGGAQLSFSARLRAQLAWASGVAFTQGSLAIDHGDLRLRHASVHTGPALQYEGKLTLVGGVGVRAGWLGLRGLPNDATARGQRFDTWFVGPTVFGSLALQVAKHAFVLLALELTHTVREVHAQVRGGQTRTLSPWLGGASLGVGASW